MHFKKRNGGTINNDRSKQIVDITEGSVELTTKLVDIVGGEQKNANVISTCDPSKITYMKYNLQFKYPSLYTLDIDSDGTNAFGYTSSLFTANANSFVVASFLSTRALGTIVDPVITGSFGSDWLEITASEYDLGRAKLSIWSKKIDEDTTGTMIFDLNSQGAPQTGGSWAIMNIDNIDLVDQIIQVAGDQNDSSSTTSLSCSLMTMTGSSTNLAVLATLMASFDSEASGSGLTFLDSTQQASPSARISIFYGTVADVTMSWNTGRSGALISMELDAE